MRSIWRYEKHLEIWEASGDMRSIWMIWEASGDMRSRGTVWWNRRHWKDRMKKRRKSKSQEKSSSPSLYAFSKDWSIERERADQEESPLLYREYLPDLTFPPNDLQAATDLLQ
jgi:hypothetical protein